MKVVMVAEEVVLEGLMMMEVELEEDVVEAFGTGQ